MIAVDKASRDGVYRRRDSKFYWMSFVDEKGKERSQSTKETEYDAAIKVREKIVREVVESKRAADAAARKVARQVRGIKTIEHNGEAYVRLADLAEFIRIGRMLDDAINAKLPDPIDCEASP